MCDSYELIQCDQLLGMEDVRRISGEEISELARHFQWNVQDMEKIVEDLLSDGVTLSRIAHLLLFAELLVERFPLQKTDIHETTLQSIARNLRF